MRSYRFLLASTLAVTLSLAACSSDPAQDSPPLEDMDSDKYKNYDDLPYQQQAVGLSLLHNFGDSSLDFGTMKSVMGGDLKSGIARLRNADEWKNPELFARRNREADLLQSLIQPQQNPRGLM